MGNGIGVINETSTDVTFGLSMGGTHYYENKVKPREIFFRDPGAVWYTTYAYCTAAYGPMTDAKKAGEIALFIVAGGAAAAATAMTAGVLGKYNMAINTTTLAMHPEPLSTMTSAVCTASVSTLKCVYHMINKRK